jgi:hypothetical protein
LADFCGAAINFQASPHRRCPLAARAQQAAMPVMIDGISQKN